MSVYSEEEETRYVDTVSDVDVDEFNHRFHEMESDESTANYRRTAPSNSKQGDEGYHCVYRKVNGQQVKVDFYETSGTPHMYIRDALTGNRLPFRTGTSDEDLFFSVRFATGETKSRDASNLFYDNPEQYERHFYTTVSHQTKEAWLQKVIEARRIRGQQQQHAQQSTKRATLVK